MRAYVNAVQRKPVITGGGGGFAEVSGGSQRATARNGSPATSLNCAFPANVTAGNLIVVGGATFDQTVTGVADTVGTTYGLQVYELGSQRLFIAYGIVPTSGANTVTVTGGNTYFSYSISEFSGAHSSPLDVAGTGIEVASTSAPSTPSLTTTVNNCLLLAVYAGTGTVTVTPDSPNIQIGEEENYSSFMTHNFCYRIVGAAGSYSTSWTLSSALRTRTAAVALKPA